MKFKLYILVYVFMVAIVPLWCFVTALSNNIILITAIDVKHLMINTGFLWVISFVMWVNALWLEKVENFLFKQEQADAPKGTGGA